jgi:carboxyl-terminal processing protease
VNTTANHFRAFVLCSIFTTLVACGGGSGGGGLGTVPPPGGGTDWQAGVFLDADTYFAQCQVPRAGINPATGSAYPDVAGSTLDENNFLRSFSNDIYLWYSEIVDRDPGLNDDPLAYFDLLRTTAMTPSGADKDKFHFTFDSEEYFQLSQGGVSAGYGANWVLLSTTPPREIVVAYSEPNSPATDVGLFRGAIVLEIDGFDINVASQVGVDALNAGLFPELGETHTFVVRDLGAVGSREISMTSEEITNAMVQNVRVIDRLDGSHVGYMTFNFHRAPAEEALVNAINQLKAEAAPGIVNDLVLDIRYNGGGFLDIASELAYMIAGPAQTAGRGFEALQFNDKHPVTDPFTGLALEPTPFHDTTQNFGALPDGQALPTLNLPRVFVLTGSGTCSASEAIMNGLRGVDVEVIQIGSTTCGKPYGFYPVDNCGTTYFTVQFRGVNEKGFGDYTDGFSPANTAANAGTVVPGCSVADDFTNPLGVDTEGRLAAALAYREAPVCPAASGLGPTPGLSKTTDSTRPADGVVYRSPWDSNRIMRQPQR